MIKSCMALQWSCPALAISPRITTRSFECILKDLPRRVVGAMEGDVGMMGCLCGAVGLCWGARVCLKSIVAFWDDHPCKLYVLALLETGCWCEHVQPLRSFISACVCLKASWLQSSVTVKWSKPSRIHQQIFTCLHHGKFAGAKVKFPSTHDGISINTWWNFQHYMSTACNACVNVDFPTKYDGISIITCLEHGHFDY